MVPVGRDPNHLFQVLQAGKLSLMPASLRRIHKIMKSCRTSVTAVSPHLDAGERLVPVNGGHRMLIHLSPWCASIRLQLCPRPRPREPASRHLLPAHQVRRRLPHHAHHPASCKVAPLFPTLPARQEGPGPPFPVKWLPQGCPRLPARVSYQKPVGRNPAHAHADNSYLAGEYCYLAFAGGLAKGAEHCRPCYCSYHERLSSLLLLYQSTTLKKKP